MVRFLPILLVVLLAVDPAGASAQVSPPPLEEFSAWLGLEPGESLAYRAGDDLACVHVEEVGDRLALVGFPWPASDGRVDLDFSSGDDRSVGWQPSDASRAKPSSPLLPSTDLRWGAPPGPASDPLMRAGSASPVPVGWPIANADGWYAIGGSRRSPERLVYVRCTACMDAGLRVVFARGRGIVSVRATTITGTSEAVLASRGCGAES